MGSDISQKIRDRKSRLRTELDRIIPILAEQYQPEKIFLFESLVHGEVREWSDLDLVIIKQTDARFLDRVAEVLDLIVQTVGMDILVYTPEEFKELTRTRPFVREEVRNKSKVIYERNS